MIEVVETSPVVPAYVGDALTAISRGATAASRETDLLDFKRQGRSRPDTMRVIAEAAMCFANAAGGVVVVGVADQTPGPAAFLGTDLDAVRVARRIFELTDPHLNVTVAPISAEGRQLLAVVVPSGPDVFQIEHRAAERVGTTCQPMSARRIATVMAERRGDDWSAVDTGVALDAADPVALEHARNLLRQSADPARRARADARDHNLLRQLGVVSPQGTLLAAGRLLFVRDSGSDDVVAYQFRRTPAGTLAANERFPFPALSAVVRVMELVTARIDSTPLNLPRGQQIQLADLPSAAIREALVNAVAHRDYRHRGVVRVEHSPTRVRVVSPGLLVSGVTPGNILTASKPRNPILANAVRAVGLAEQAGVGVDRMYVEMTRLGHEPPVFVSEGDEVSVTLLGGAPNTHLARFVATLPPDDADDADTLLVIYTLLHSRKVTAPGLAPLLQKPAAEVENELRRLGAPPLSILEPTRQSARRSHPEYRLQESAVATLGPAVTYRRRTQDEIDRKVIGIVQETGQVNARMVKLMLDLDPLPASRILADLVARNILTKTSKAQRGRTVTYGPGPGFPTTARPRRGAVAGVDERE